MPSANVMALCHNIGMCVPDNLTVLVKRRMSIFITTTSTSFHGRCARPSHGGEPISGLAKAGAR